MLFAHHMVPLPSERSLFMTEPRRPTRLPDPTTDEEPMAPLDETSPSFHSNGVPPLEEGPDPFDVAALRVTQDLAEALSVKRPLTSVAVRKPAKEWFFRVHPDPEYAVDTCLIELKETNELYLVAPQMRDDLAGETTFCVRRLFLCCTRQNTPFFWPVGLPKKDGRPNSWSDSARDAAEIGMTAWIRLQSNRELGIYQPLISHLPAEPLWPNLSVSALLRLAFQDKFITSWEHPILRQLRNEV
jgi:hypothetical protein